jgi:hypothetical protein
MALFAYSVFGHAVAAPEIAEFRDGKTEIGDLASVFVMHNHPTLQERLRLRAVN